MPLAIELAASRLRSITPAEMLQRLQGGAATPQLDLLARPVGGGAMDPRHASMLRTIEWSWRQLDDAQRRLAGAMSVFGGGCSLRMLQHVSGGDAELAGVLDQLQSHSLVHARACDPAMQDGTDPDGDAQRFQLYEPIREYARAQFGAEQAAHWRGRHRDWAIAWARALPATPSLAEVRALLPNIGMALHSALADGAGDDAVRLLIALQDTLEDVELPAAALAHAGAAVDACRDDMLRSRGHTALGPLLFAAGQKKAALRHVEAALDCLPDDPASRARALYAVARVRWRGDLQHPERVLPMAEAAYALAAAADDAGLMAGLLSLRAFATHVRDGTPEAALALHRRALQQWERSGNRHAVNNGRYNVAVFEFHAGRAALALSQFDALSAEATVLQDWRRLAIVSDARGAMLAELRRWPEAARAHRESLALGWQVMSVYNLAYAFWNLPRSLAHLRQPALALSLAAFSEVFWSDRVGDLSPSDARELLRVRRLAARQLDARACAQAWARGRVLSLPEAMALALGR
jgi:tetratricopeptide (TPR) repeat protein